MSRVIPEFLCVDGSGSEELETVQWTAGLSLLIYGVRIGIRTNRPDILDRLLDYLPPLWKPSSSRRIDRLFSLHFGNQTHRLFAGSEKIVTSGSENVILRVFEARLKMYVAEMARRRVFIHAGAVGWNGKAIIIPGHSMSGKTSLVAELVRAGAVYYSDEYAVLDDQGRVHPYPQHLAVRKNVFSRQKKIAVEEIGGVAGTAPLPAGLILISRYQQGAQWRPKMLSAGQSVLELLAHTVPARRKPAMVIPILQKAVSVSTVLKGKRGEAAEIVRLILKE